MTTPPSRGNVTRRASKMLAVATLLTTSAAICHGDHKKPVTPTEPLPPSPQVVFWTRSDSLTPLSVHLEGQDGQPKKVTTTHGTEPACGANGAATFTLSSGGTRRFQALFAPYRSVEGSVNASSTGCIRKELTYAPPLVGGVGYNLRIQSVNPRPPAKVSVVFQLTNEVGAPVVGFPLDSIRIFDDLNVPSGTEAKYNFQPKSGRFVAHAILLVDVSGSIVEGSTFALVKQASENFVRSLVPPADSVGAREVEVGIWTFSSASSLHQVVSRSRNRDSLITAIRSIQPGSPGLTTDLYSAVLNGVQTARTRLEASSNANEFAVASVVLFTDGSDEAHRKTYDETQVAVNAVKSLMSVYTVGLGSEIQPERLAALGYSGFFQALETSQLAAAFQSAGQRIRAEANSYYLLDYCSSRVTNLHALKIEARFRERIGAATAEYDAQGFHDGCTL